MLTFGKTSSKLEITSCHTALRERATTSSCYVHRIIVYGSVLKEGDLKIFVHLKVETLPLDS